MTTDQLNNFLIVAKYKNFTRAASQLYIGQPALSRQIADLEQQFGVKLFIRNNRKVELTPAGEILQKEATKLLDQIENIRITMESANCGKTGRINIASIGNISDKCSAVSKMTIAEFQTASIKIQQEERGIIHHLLLSKEIDIGLTLEFIVSGVEGLDYYKVDTMRFVLLIPDGHPLSKKEKVYLDDIAPFSKVILNLEHHAAFIKKIISADDLLLRKNLILADGMTALMLYADIGAGIGIAPEFIMGSRYKGNYSVHYLMEKDIKENIVIVWRKEETNPLVSDFIKTYCRNADKYKENQNDLRM